MRGPHEVRAARAGRAAPTRGPSADKQRPRQAGGVAPGRGTGTTAMSAAHEGFGRSTHTPTRLMERTPVRGRARARVRVRQEFEYEFEHESEHESEHEHEHESEHEHEHEFEHEYEHEFEVNSRAAAGWRPRAARSHRVPATISPERC